MKQDITTFRIRKRQNRAQRPAFAFQEPLYAGFSAGSPVLNEVLLDVCCVDLARDRKGAIIVSPHQGEKDGPTQPYPTPRPDGRGPHGALLPHRRRLRPSQPPCPLLRVHKAPLGLGSHRPRPLPAAAGRRKRTLLLARRPEVLLPPVPRSGGAAPFLVPSKG